MTAESINSPAIGDLDGDGKDDIVVATNEVYGGAAASGAATWASAGCLCRGGVARAGVYAVKCDDGDVSSPAGRSSRAASSRTSCR